MELIVKDLNVSELSDDKNVYVEGYASAAVKDLYDEIITEEALKEAAKDLTREPYNKVFLNHKHDDIPIGKIIEAEVRNGKLWIKLMLNKAHPMFETVYKSLKDGFLDAFSIGFKVLAKQGNKITKLKIVEVSLVGIPANPEATVEAVYEKNFEPEEVRGIVPRHTFKYGVDTESPWKKPTLKDFTDKSWDELSIDERKFITAHYAWTPKNPPDRFSDLKFPHHNPTKHKKPHAVNKRGVIAGFVRLHVTKLPEEDRRGIYNHLSDHAKNDLDMEPPDFKSILEFDQKFVSWIRKTFTISELKSLIANLAKEDCDELALKSLNLLVRNMESELESRVKELEAENQKLREEIDQLKTKLAEYEAREKAEIIEKIKSVAKIAKAEIDEEKLKSAGLIELKLLYADLADKALSTKQVAEKVKTVLDEPEYIDSPFGKLDVKRYKELRKLVGLE